MSSNTINHRGARVVCSLSCPVNHIDNASRVTKVDGWPDIRGLHSLNASRNQWLAGDAIEKSIEVYVRGFPDALQQMIGLGILSLNSGIWHTPKSNQYHAGKDLLLKAIASPPRRLVKKLKANEWSIFPLNINNNHWILIVMRKNQVPSADDPNTMEWSRVVQAAVLDPYRDAGTMDFVHSTLRTWLTRAAGFTFATDYVKKVWVPLQRDTSSCGPRAYWHAKQILDRLFALHEDGIHYDASIWNDLSGWINEGFVRDEMIGRCAAAAVREMDYNARVAVEVVYMTKSYGDHGSTRGWTSAKTMMEPVCMKGKKPEARPNRRPLNQIPGQGLSQLMPAPGNIRDYPGGGMNTTTNITNMAPPPLPPFIAPPQTPNQHRIAPGARPGARPASQQNPIVIDSDSGDSGSSSSMSPTFPPVPPPRNPMIAPTPGSGSLNPIDLISARTQQATDLTPEVGQLRVRSPRSTRLSIPSRLPRTRTSGAGPGVLAATSRDAPPATGSSPLNPITIGGTGSRPGTTGRTLTVPTGASSFNPITIDDDDGNNNNPQGYLPTPDKTSPSKRLASGANEAESPSKRVRTDPPNTQENKRAPRQPPAPRGGRGSRRPPRGGGRGPPRGGAGAGASAGAGSRGYVEDYVV